MVSGEVAGKIYRFDAASGTIPRSIFNPYSTHSFSVAEAIQLAFALDKLPPNLVVFGIEGSSFEAGESVSFEVAGSIKIVVGKIVDEISITRESQIRMIE